MTEKLDTEGLDVAGFGKIAKAIPPKVYEKSATAIITTFQKLISPLTATTEGFGRYVEQKFDNMVAAEKAIATYAIEKAVQRAQAKAALSGTSIAPPTHPKSFVKSIEEAARETDPLMHEMWVNLLASQLVVDGKSHPHFVEILTHFSPAEAQLLTFLLPRSEVGISGGNYLSFNYDIFKFWKPCDGGPISPWTLSCVLLCEFHFADVLAPRSGDESNKGETILYRTATGTAFLSVVSSPEMAELGGYAKNGTVFSD